MPRNSERSFCCGAGGARMWMEENLGTRINDSRTTEASGAMPDLFRLLGVFMRCAVALNGQGPYC